MFRSLVLCIIAPLAMPLLAQGGIRLLVSNVEPFVVGGAQHVGIGLDLDLADRLSLGVQGRMSIGVDGWVLNYRTAYHFNDAEYASFYFGPLVGYRHIGAQEGVNVIPLGFQLGWRGGLERFYADLHLGGHYNLGADEVLLEGGVKADILKTSFCAGLDLGWGWAGRNTRH
ncbi:MAG: hypothetical protein R2815_12905 [Flavobacteriales bacterium]